jgi:hypothetical protein
MDDRTVSGPQTPRRSRAGCRAAPQAPGRDDRPGPPAGQPGDPLGRRPSSAARRSTTCSSSVRRDSARPPWPCAGARDGRPAVAPRLGPAIEKPGDLVGLLTNLARRGHPLHRRDPSPQAGHRGIPLSRDGGLPDGHRLSSEGPKAQTITMPIERFTLIGATTRFGLLTPPMRARFGIVAAPQLLRRRTSSTSCDALAELSCR